MAMLIWELGADTSSYKKDMEGATAITESGFQRIGSAAKAGTEKSGEGVKGLQHGIRQLKELVMAGGAVEAVKRFFDLAAEAAEKSSNANDQNAQAVLRFTSAAKGLKEEAADLAMKVVGTANRIGETFGSALRYAKEYWQAAISGNKANLEAFDQAEASERAAMEQERAAAELRKKHGAELNQINAEIKQTTEAIAQAQRKQLEPAEQVNKLSEDRKRIEAEIAGGQLDAVERRKHALDLLKNEKDMIEAMAALDKQRHTEKITQNKQELEVTLKGMSAEQQLAYLAENIKSAETIIAAQKKSGADTTVLQAQLDDLRAQKAKTAGALETERLETKRKAAGTVSEELDLLELQDKVTKGIATGSESERLKQIQLQRKERELELELEKLAQKAIDGELTPADKKRLAELTKQKAKLDEQIEAKTKLIEGAKEQQKAEANVTSEYSKQIEKASQLNRIKDGFEVKVTRIGENYDQQSTDALEGVRDRLTKDLTNAKIDQGNWQTFANGERYNMAANVINSELAKVQQELKMRSEVQQYAARYGDSAARYQYGDTVTQRALSNLSTDTSRQAQATEQINQRLAGMGFGLTGPTMAGNAGH